MNKITHYCLNFKQFFYQAQLKKLMFLKKISISHIIKKGFPDNFKLPNNISNSHFI